MCFGGKHLEVEVVVSGAVEMETEKSSMVSKFVA